LWAQMEEADAINQRRLGIWATYHEAFAGLETAGKLRRPMVPDECVHNAHMYYLLLRGLEQRTAFMKRLKANGVYSVFHYIPLHSSPRGRTVGRYVGDMAHTDRAADQLVRLPMWLGLEDQQAEVIQKVIDALA